VLVALLAGATALTVAPDRARANPPADPGSTWTFPGANDSVSTTPGGSDKYYTSGLRIGWTAGTEAAPDGAAKLANAVWATGRPD
jgi:hypothetical protein